jgi:hypothetical protein
MTMAEPGRCPRRRRWPPGQRRGRGRGPVGSRWNHVSYNDRMSWLRRLVGRDAKVVPEGYERVRCDRCKGTGLMMYAPGNIQTMEARVRIPRCPHCGGKGWTLSKKPE